VFLSFLQGPTFFSVLFPSFFFCIGPMTPLLKCTRIIYPRQTVFFVGNPPWSQLFSPPPELWFALMGATLFAPFGHDHPEEATLARPQMLKAFSVFPLAFPLWRSCSSILLNSIRFLAASIGFLQAPTPSAPSFSGRDFFKDLTGPFRVVPRDPPAP